MRKFYFSYMVIILLLTVGLLAIFLVLTEKKMNLERTSSYEKLLGDVVEISKIAIEERLTDTKISMNNFLERDNSSFENVTKSFDENRKLFQKDYITMLLVTEDGMSYSSGKDFSFEGMSLTHESISFLTREDVNYVVLSVKMPETLIIEGMSFDYYVHVI